MVALYVFVFGTVITCCAHTHPGMRFWRPERIFYGLLPIALSIAVFVWTAKIWKRTYSRRRNAWLMGCFLAVVALFADLAVYWKQHRRYDEGIDLVWKSETSTFSWGPGEIRVPPGFMYQTDQGMDTYIGHFTSPDGRITIEHDIGELAADHTGLGDLETSKQGSRVRRGRGSSDDKKLFSIVSFPDSGCANFYLISPNERDLEIIDEIAQSFRPKGRMPGWMRPLLPEVLRTDCRYRFTLPAWM